MARDLKLNVDGDSSGGQKSLESVAAAADVAAREASKMARQFKQAQHDAAGLDRQLAETAITTRALAREFAKTNDSAIKASLVAQKKASSDLKALRKDIIGDLEQGAKEAEKLAAAAAKSLAEAKENAKTFGGLGEAGGPLGLGLAGVAAGPGLAAAGGLALGGLGIAGAGLGVAGAVMGNPQAFQDAWAAATGEVQKDLINAGAAFTGPALDALKTIGPTIDSWHLRDALAPAAQFVPVIVKGVEGAASGLEHGFAKAIGKAGPAVYALSTGLTQLGVAGGDALSHIADGAEGGAEALHDVISGVALLTEGFGYAVEGAEKLYDFFEKHPIEAGIATGGLSVGASIWANALGNVDDAGIHLGQTLKGVSLSGSLAGDQAKADAASFSALAAQLRDDAVNANTFAGAMSDKVFNSLLAADHATLGWYESLTSLSASFKENGRSIDITTEAGQRNREAVLAAVQANIQQYDTNIAAHQTAEQATAAYDANTAALEHQLHQAHFTQAQIDSLIGTYALVPKTTDTDIELHGFEDAIHDLEDTLAKLFKIDGYVAHARVVVDDEYIANRQSTYDEQVPRYKLHGGIRHAAAGMIVPPRNPGTVLFGEPQTGGEAFIPLGSSISDSGAASIARVVGVHHGFDVVPRGSRVPPHLFGGGGSGGPVAVTAKYTGSGGGLEAMFFSWFAAALKNGNLGLTVDASGSVKPR